MAIEIIKGVSEITAVIRSIGSSQATYKEAASSALLSAVQHYIAHQDYTLIQNALDEMYQVNYRDYKVFVTFLKSLTHVGLTMEKDGRREMAIVVGTLEDTVEARKTNEKASDYDKRKKSAKDNVITRKGMFDNFAQGKETQVRNPDWEKGMDKELRTVGVCYNMNIFDWFDDVNYMRVKDKNEEAAKEMSDEQVLKYMGTIFDKLLKTSNCPVEQLLKNLVNGTVANERTLLTAEGVANIKKALDSALETADRQRAKRAESQA